MYSAGLISQAMSFWRKAIKSRILSRSLPFLPILWIAAALVVDIFCTRKTIDVWPPLNRRVLAFSDQPEGGRSTSKALPTPTKLLLSLRLDSGVTWPVAGTIFFLDRKGTDLSGPGELELELAHANLGLLTLCLVEDLPGFTRDDQWHTARYECMDQELVPGTASYRIPLEKFITPSWWYTTAGIRPSTIGPERRKRVVRVVLQTGPGTPLRQEIDLRIARLSIAPSNTPLRLAIWGLSLALAMIHLALIRLKASKPAHSESVKPPPPGADPYFQPVEAVSYADRERDAVVQCIGNDYADPDLSLEKIARSTGVPADRVTQHVKMASGLLFKAYLNKVRGEAARKLLLETDLPIAEISQRVGYSNTPHFNRVFKELFDTTPTALRGGPQSEPETVKTDEQGPSKAAPPADPA
jgi:AraC-like DNA-binding protein